MQLNKPKLDITETNDAMADTTTAVAENPQWNHLETFAIVGVSP